MSLINNYRNAVLYKFRTSWLINMRKNFNYAATLLIKSNCIGETRALSSWVDAITHSRLGVSSELRILDFAGVLSGLRNIVKTEKFIALYKGNGAQMVRIFPYAATQFTAFEIYKKVLKFNLGCGRWANNNTLTVFDWPAWTQLAR